MDNSNTTNVKVKLIGNVRSGLTNLNSNTTNVKVKLMPILTVIFLR